MKRQRIKGLANNTDNKTHKNVEKIPFDMVLGGRKIIHVNYQITYQYDSVENLKFDLDYGIRSVGKLINA